MLLCLLAFARSVLSKRLTLPIIATPAIPHLIQLGNCPLFFRAQLLSHVLG